MTRVVLGFLGLILIMMGIPVLLAWSAGRRRPRLARVGGAVVLRLPRGHNALLAAIAVLPFAAIAITALAVTWAPGTRAWVLAAVMGAIGAIVGSYLLALEVRQRIRVDAFSIERVGVFTRRRYAWREVAKVTFNPVNNWFFLTTTSGRRIYFVEKLEGIADFAELALAHLPPAVLAASPDAVEALKDIAGVA